MERITIYRTIFLVLSFLGLVEEAWGQNNSSDAAYARGVELYGMRKYEEAIPFFQKTDSLERLEMVEGTSQGLNTIWWIANCYYKLGDVGKAKEVEPYYYMLVPVDRRLTVESDSLSEIGLKLMQEGNYENAVDYFKRSGDFEKTVLGANSHYYGNTLSLMAECYWELEDYDTAFSLANNALKIQRFNAFDYGIAHCYELLGLICENMEEKGFENAFGYYQLAYDKYNSADYAIESVTALIEMSSIKQKMGEVQDAYDLCIKAKDIIDKDNLFAEYLGSYAYLLSVLAQAEYGLFMYEETFEHSSEAKLLFEQDDIEMYHDAYIMNEGWRAYASRFVPGCDHPQVVREAYEAFMSSDDFKDSPICKMVEILYYKCNPDNIPLERRIAAQRRLMEELEVAEGCKSASYLEVLADILNDYEEETTPNVQEIIAIYEEIVPLFDRVEELNLSDKTCLLKNMATIEYAILNDLMKAIATLSEGINLLKEEGWEYSLYYCQLLNHIAQMYLSIDDYPNAYGYLQEAMEIYAITDENNKDLDIYRRDEYVNTLQQLMTYYGNIGDLKQQEECFNKLSIASPHFCNDNDALFMYKLSAIMRSDETDDAKIGDMMGACQERLRLIRESKGTSNLDYSLISIIYSYFLVGQGNTEEANKIISEAREYISSNFKVSAVATHVELVYANLLMLMGDVEGSISLYTKVLPAAEGSHSVSPQNLTLSYQNLVSMYGDEGKYSEAQPYIRKILDAYKGIINNNFRSMAYEERSSLWDKYSDWFISTLPVVAYHGNDSALDEYLYDGLLLSKGLLLNSEIGLRKLVASSGDEYSLALYEQLQALYARRKKAIGNSEEYERISREVTTKERELAISVKSFGDYTKDLTLTWEDVRDGLSPEEAAIEFVAAPISQDSIIYSALVLRPGESPKRVNLFTQQELTAIPSDSLYTGSMLSHLIWEPLSDVLEGAKDVYFAPQGMLHSMAIEYAPTSDGGYISDKYNLYRLSSTRERILSHTTKKEQYAVLYGGLNYDADTTAVMRANDDQTSHYVFKPRAAIENIRDVAQGVSDLQYTLEEVEEIGNLYSAVNEDCYSFKGIYGTEESFKKLSGTGKTVLHLATHGFYYTEVDYKNRFNFLQTLDILDNVAVSSEDKMLTRSGLFLTGVNAALTGQSIPNAMEDGILTAQEIAFLDFRDVDLVVLSACKSAMGKLGGDGVFGLQRGFKKAGAHTLLMSLWNVDDRATKLLMTEFYRNWLGVGNGNENMSKREAFLKAQEYLRTTENERYKDPKYWAAFVMLDGIN